MSSPSEAALTAALNSIKASKALIDARSKEQPIRDSFTSYLRQMFPDEPSWVRHHVTGAESSVALHRPTGATTGFIDNLVDLTAIEYESDLRSSSRFETGYGQVKDYCAALLNKGYGADKVIGILSDTVRWYAYKVQPNPSAISGSITRDNLEVIEIDRIDMSTANKTSAYRLLEFLSKHLGRLASRPLSAENIASDLGFDSLFASGKLDRVEALIDKAFTEKPAYGEIIKTLWGRLVGYLSLDAHGKGTFEKKTYAYEFYILTLAKLICANILERQALDSDDDEFDAILSGHFFKNRNLSNLVEYDYFGWLSEEPYLSELRQIAQEVQRDLRAYDFTSTPQEDIFGELMAQLASRTQRLLLGQEWTPAWLARKIVDTTISVLPEGETPRFIDMCCGSGTMIAETLKATSHLVDEKDEGAFTKLTQAITGFDIDPLAVLLAKITWVVTLRDRLATVTHPVTIPIYHADSLFTLTPLSQDLMFEEGSGHFALDIDGETISLPAYLLTPTYQVLFDHLLDLSYDLAETAAQNRTRVDMPIVRTGVEAALTSMGAELELDQIEEVTNAIHKLTNHVADLTQRGRNGVWVFILRNSYRPSLAAGQFNGLVSNPPWLTMSKLADNPYKASLSRLAERYNITPSGSSHLHLELATVFFVHALDRYLEDGAVVGCILPETVLNGYHHNGFRKGNYRSAARRVTFNLLSIWAIESGTFKNRATVLFGTKRNSISPQGKIPGKLVSEDKVQDTQFYWNEQGKRTAWTEVAPSSKPTGFFVPASFKQGADIMPRALFAVEAGNELPSMRRKIASIGDKTSQQYFAVADAKKFGNFRLTPTDVPSSFIFTVLTSAVLTPLELFHNAALKAFLPIEKYTGGWTFIELMAMRTKDTKSFRVLKQIEDSLATEGRNNTAKERLDIRGKLSQQALGSSGYLVVTGAGGEVPCSAYVPVEELDVDRLVIDQTLYWTQVESEDEALYLTGLLNSSAVQKAISDFVPRGEQGGRHIHTLPFGVTPPFDQNNTEHMKVVESTRQLLREYRDQKSRVTELGEMLNPNKGSLSRRRFFTRRQIQRLLSYGDYEAACRMIYAV